MDSDLTGMLPVPGAILYYTVRGSGPPILILPNGGGDAHSADRLVSLLTGDHTVFTYDRRGQTRTTTDDPRPRPSIEQHADDASRLLDYLSTEPVSVFGCSTGAVIGLDLVLHHPERVRTLVAHEPPLRILANEADRVRYDAVHLEAQRLYRQVSLAASLRLLRVAFDNPQFNPLDHEDGVTWAPPSRRALANADFFVANDAGATWRYTLDRAGWETLSSSSTNIVPAAGSTKDLFPAQCATLLAETIGKQLVQLPGAHDGYQTHPKAFASALLRHLSTAMPESCAREVGCPGDSRQRA